MKKPVLAVLGVACLAIFATTAASASAAVFTTTNHPCSGGTNVALCYENAGKEKLLLTGEQSVSLSSGVARFAIRTKPAQEFTCTASTGSGAILQKEPTVPGGKTTIRGRFTYSGCKLLHVPYCEVDEVIEGKELEGTLVSEHEVKLQPAAPGGVIMEYEYRAEPGKSCGLEGKHSLTGSITAEVINAATPETTKTVKTFGETLVYLSSKALLATEPTISFTGLGQRVYVSKEA
jgi:hypothetical protein